MQSCRDVARLIASDDLEHAGWVTRFLTRLHLLYCKRCRRYARELETIGQVSRDTWDIASVDTQTVRRLEGTILDHAFDASRKRPQGNSGDSAEPSDG